MAMRENQAAVRRILAAEGYLELGMAAQAERELSQIPSGTPLEGPRQFLRGHICRLTSREEEAAKCFRAAAHLMPPPIALSIWAALHDAYRSAGATSDARSAFLHGTKAAAQIEAAMKSSDGKMVFHVPGGTMQINFVSHPPSQEASDDS